MSTVVVKNGNLDLALRKFKQKQARDGVPSEVKKREAYSNLEFKEEKQKKRVFAILVKEIVLVAKETSFVSLFSFSMIYYY